MKRTVKFLDSDRKLVVAKCEITTRNRYPEFTMCGEYDGGFGQVFDHVDPANEHQEDLITFWKEWHLKDVSKCEGGAEAFESDLNEILDDIKQAEMDENDREIEEDDIDLFEDFNEPETALALAIMIELKVSEVQDIQEEGDCRWYVQGVDYLAGTDAEMDEVWDEELENYLDEFVLPDLPETARRYFDREAWKKDAEYDGRGHALNRYDGGELYVTIGEEDYYAYRQ